MHRLGTLGDRAVVVEVPPSVDGPHLIYRNELFGAPIRNDADTVWMKERQIETMYRTRFDDRRHAGETLDRLYVESAGGRATTERAWLIAVAHPRLPRLRDRLTRDCARGVLTEAGRLGIRFAGQGGFHPLENVDGLNPRPGLRRWVAVNAAVGDPSPRKEAWASLHHDGSVTLAAAVGSQRASHDSYFKGSQVPAAAIEGSVADLMALVRATADVTGDDEYDVRVGIEWSGFEPLTIPTMDNFGHVFYGASYPLHRYVPVESTIKAAAPYVDFHWQVHDLAQDCVNQGGVSNVTTIQPPARDEPA